MSVVRFRPWPPLSTVILIDTKILIEYLKSTKRTLVLFSLIGVVVAVTVQIFSPRIFESTSYFHLKPFPTSDDEVRRLQNLKKALNAELGPTLNIGVCVKSSPLLSFLSDYRGSPIPVRPQGALHDELEYSYGFRFIYLSEGDLAACSNHLWERLNGALKAVVNDWRDQISFKLQEDSLHAGSIAHQVEGKPRAGEIKAANQVHGSTKSTNLNSLEVQLLNQKIALQLANRKIHLNDELLHLGSLQLGGYDHDSSLLFPRFYHLGFLVFLFFFIGVIFAAIQFSRKRGEKN